MRYSKIETECWNTHLGSEISAAWRTRPQYVFRSYCDAGRSRLPGIDADMAASLRKAVNARNDRLKKREIKKNETGQMLSRRRWEESSKEKRK